MRKKILLIVCGIIVLIVVAILTLLKLDLIHPPISVQSLDIDCKETDSLFQVIYSNEFIERQKDINFKELVELDYHTASLAISIIESCGMPNWEELSKQQIIGFVMAFHHLPDKSVRSKYEYVVDKLYQDGFLSCEVLALYKDRLLVDKGMPQLYGTQFKGRKLFKVDNLDSVQVRRQKCGMDPLEEYLKRFGVNY